MPGVLVGDGLLPQVEQVKWEKSGVGPLTDGVMQVLYWSVVLKRQLSVKAKLLISIAKF